MAQRMVLRAVAINEAGLTMPSPYFAYGCDPAEFLSAEGLAG